MYKSDVCRSKIKYEKTQVNVTEKNLCAVVIEVNMVENNNPKKWGYDT